MKVEIKGRNLIPCVKLLESLTRTGLLSPKLTWEESLDKATLTIADAPPEFKDIFEQKGFTVKDE